MKDKIKVLIICSHGINRSKYLASYLKGKGYLTRFGGIKEGAENPLKEKYIEWADIIVFAKKKHLNLFEEKYPDVRKKSIILGVSDSPETVAKEFPDFKWDVKDNFHKVWTYPQLRKSIKQHLPFKK